MARWQVPIPRDTWHVVAGADALRPGRVLDVDVDGRRLAVAAGAEGPFALASRCPHQGAELAGGRVDGVHLRCPLHGLGFGADGRCDRAGVPPAEPVPVAVAAGAVMIPGGASAGPAPVPGRFGPLAWAPARRERVPVPWATIVVNAFDLHHLHTVHHRAVVQAPVFDQPAPDRLRMAYATRPVGGGLTDALTRGLSPGRLDLHLTLVGGLLLWVEAELGRTRSAAVVGLAPRGEETDLWLSVGVPPGPGARLRGALGRWLYQTFLRRDVPVLRGVHLSPRSPLPEDEPVQRLVDWLEAREPLGAEHHGVTW